MAKERALPLEISIMHRSERGARPIQQDAIRCSNPDLYRERGLLAVLSDGMGGMKNGEVYSEIAVNEMVDHFESQPPANDIILSLLECYGEARRAARARCPEPDDPEGGATVVAVYVRDGRCAFLSVGDSRLYLWRANALLQLNREQTLGVLLDENAAMGYIPKEYTQSGFRDAIENNLCEPEVKHCDMPAYPFSLVPGDRLLLMSDGVPHTLSDREIAQTIREMDSEGAAAALEQAVLRKQNPKQDNYTILEIIVQKPSGKNKED